MRKNEEESSVGEYISFAVHLMVYPWLFAAVFRWVLYGAWAIAAWVTLFGLALLTWALFGAWLDGAWVPNQPEQSQFFQASVTQNPDQKGGE